MTGSLDPMSDREHGPAASQIEADDFRATGWGLRRRRVNIDRLRRHEAQAQEIVDGLRRQAARPRSESMVPEPAAPQAAPMTETKVGVAAATPATKAPTPVSRPAAAKRLADSRLAELPENHTPSEAAAHALIRQFGDLEPSVNRIMSADLSEEARLHAVGLFQASLGVPGDPNRMPINAIETARRFKGKPDELKSQERSTA